MPVAYAVDYCIACGYREPPLVKHSEGRDSELYACTKCGGTLFAFLLGNEPRHLVLPLPVVARCTHCRKAGRLEIVEAELLDYPCLLYTSDAADE